MTSMTNNVVAQVATVVDVLPLDQMALIGTIVKPDGTQAILRNGIGYVRLVSVGDTTLSGRITAIDEQSVILTGMDGQLVLQMMN